MWFGIRRKSGLYKVWSDYPDGYDFPSCRIANIGDVDLRFDTGASITRPVPDKIIYEVDKDLPLQDLMNCTGDVLVSDRLAQLISRMSSCAVYYAAEVHFEGQPIRTDCKTVNFTKSFPCLNMKKSKFSEIGLAKRIVIDEERIPKREHVFRPSEYVATIFADQVFVDEVKSLGITGVRFDPK